MLKSWSIQNFKPILDSGELKLAPVTVLAGRNSSGKSSLIQSILMIEQTLSSRILDRPLLPNGPIIQLGTFEDILSEQTGMRTLEVSFELETDKEEQKASASARISRVDGRFIVRPGTNIKSVKISTKFRSASSFGTSTSAIEASKVNIESVSMELVAFPYRQLPLFSEDEPETETSLEFTIDIKRLSVAELERFLKDVLPEYIRLVPYPAQETNYLSTFKLKGQSDKNRLPAPSLVAFSHFLPTRLIGKYIIKERRKSRLIQAIDLAFFMDDFTPLSEFVDIEAPISDNLREAMIEFYKHENIPEAFNEQNLPDMIHRYKSLKLGQRKRGITRRLKDFMMQNILENSSQVDISNNSGTEALEAVNSFPFIEYLDSGVEQITQFFTSKIRYLGPLRADPQAAQKFAPSSELDDIGQKGEYAAAVYDANHNARIRWYNPFSEKIEQGTLKVALDTWARYLGVAHEVKIQTAGQSGVSWQVVHMEGHKALPLTAVGVGVSQVLPILVMGLLSPSNTLLLVEQPELHLHPSVQARLGDFFMGLAKCDKQCLIETHSENLVSQLRYHIVHAGGQEHSDCLIYFVDQDEQGATRFNPIQISPQGNILNWPDGFFDETMLQEDRITAASMKKRAKKATND
jgi:predicted ATPase